MALTEKGYIRPSFDEIVADKEQKAKDIFGEDIDTSDQTPLGKYIRINAYDEAKIYEDIEALYYARYPNTATGTSLDRLCPLAQITRNPATPAAHTIKLIGTLNAVVPMGFLVSTEDGSVQFYTLQDCELSTVEGEWGSGLVEVECETAGVAGNIPVGGIKEIVNPSADVERIEHVSIDVYGTEEETDPDLRARFSLSLSGSGEGNIDSIKGAVARVPTVISVELIENDTESTDEATGIPPHSFCVYVYGGADKGQEIAQAIFSKKPVGVRPYGNETYTAVDSGGNPHNISFSYTSTKQLRMKVNLKVNARFEETGKNDVQANIANYINNLGVGGDVILSSLYGHIHSVVGVVEALSIEVSVNGGEYSAQNVYCERWEVAKVLNEDIEVTAVIV